ncbi:hypothetical protein [Chelatococcus sp. XZ-Ab1]|uniref:hypothetical protein n=1 Tax=Chelatococcus sp. XZ-Ab1 TaxID=3034027 RepID=UPI0023E40626|nr:hypothetical protein [Chelatococcus sp. XZ-Ab1]
MRTREPIKNPRRLGSHVVAALDLLASLGIKDVQIYKTTHLRVFWPWGPGRLAITLPCTPRNYDEAARQARHSIRRTIEEAVARPMPGTR